MAGLQCTRRLWLLANEPAAHEEPEPGSVLDFGRIIGEKARLLFPGGILVEEAAFQHAQAVARTAALIADPDVPAIFEAAFTLQDIRIRVDVLERRPAGWRLLEVKSSTEVKDHHLDDVALQAFVLAGLSVPVESHFLVHVNKDYIRGAGEVDWPAYFTRADVGDEIAKRLPSLPDRLSLLGSVLLQAAPPHAEPSKKRCRKPVDCGFWDRCTAEKPSDWVGKLPYFKKKQAAALAALGVESIADIPAEFPLPHNQAVVRDVVISGEPYIAQDLQRLLHGFGPPALYLDFEAMSPPIPLYEGTRPYETLPFQWSLHIDDGIGELRHLEFLADGKSDPRWEFAQSLIAAVAGNDDPIIVYSGYEHARLKELAAQYPDLRDGIEAVITRLVDLLKIVRGAVYFPAFDYSNSIKFVAPALAPGFTYDDLDGVAGGGAAAAAFMALAAGDIPDAAEQKRIRDALLAYCKRDTMAMVVVHRALSSIQNRKGIDIVMYPALAELNQAMGELINIKDFFRRRPASDEATAKRWTENYSAQIAERFEVFPLAEKHMDTLNRAIRLWNENRVILDFLNEVGGQSYFHSWFSSLRSIILETNSIPVDRSEDGGQQYPSISVLPTNVQEYALRENLEDSDIYFRMRTRSRGLVMNFGLLEHMGVLLPLAVRDPEISIATAQIGATMCAIFYLELLDKRLEKANGHSNPKSVLKFKLPDFYFGKVDACWQRAIELGGRG